MAQSFFYPPTSASSPSVGLVNSTAPTSADQIGFTNAGGNLVSVSTTNPLPVDITITSPTISENLAKVNGNTVDTGIGAAGAGTQRVAVASNSTINVQGGNSLAVKVDGSAVTQPISGSVSVSSLPSIPAGSNAIGSITNTSFAATQATASALNATVIGTSAAGSGASSGLVTIQGNASGTPVPITGTVTSTNPAIGSNGSAAPTSSLLIGGSDGTNLQPLQVDASKNLKVNLQTALPAGSNAIGSITNTSFIATQATAANLNATVTTTQLPSSLGAQVTAASTAVNIASDQIVNTIQSDLTASGTITTQNLVPGGTATAGSAVAISTAGKGTVTIQVTGTYTGALSPQVTTDGTNWITQAGGVLQNMATGGTSATIPSASVGIWQIEINGHAQFRITALAAVTGTATITLRAAAGTSQVSVSGVATAANQTSVIGSTAPGTAAASSMLHGGIYNSAGVTLTNGQQAAVQLNAAGAMKVDGSAVTQPVSVSGTVATTQAAKTKGALARNDYSSTNVTTGAYVQLIASTSTVTSLVEIFDSSGQTLVLAVGGAGSEVDQFYINPGGNGQIPFAIPSGSRVSIKAVTATAASGYINLTLYT
jgi:hypothetical protein